MNKPLCCGKPILVGPDKSTGKGYIAFCPNCNRKATGKNAAESIKTFNAFNNPESTALAVLPPARRKVMQFLTTRKTGLMKLGPADVDTSVLTQIYDDNVRYVTNSPHLDKVLTTEQGIESVQHALEEAFSMLVTLGKSGDIVPFGNEASLIESVEAQKFCLTTGAAAPFEKDTVEIEVIHKNDRPPNKNADGEIYYGSTTIAKVNGNMVVSVTPGCPRGEIVQVVVYGQLKSTKKIIGHVYDKQTLLDKAKASPAYRQYLADKEYFQQLKSEGKLKQMNGQYYMEKEIPKRDGTTWTKKIFESDITNPYAEDSGNQSEMLTKVAGKSFLRKYMKVRNSEAAAMVINSMTEEEQLEKGLNDTVGAMEAEDDFVDAEMDDDIEAEFEIEEEGEDEKEKQMDGGNKENNTDKNPNDRPAKDAEEEKNVVNGESESADGKKKDSDLELF
jgi:hypothetical protein